MPALAVQFDTARQNVEPTSDDKDNAPEAHALVRDALAADAALVDWGLSPVLIGSYARSVSIRRMKDVDLFGRLNDLPGDMAPLDVLNRFEQAIRKHLGTGVVERQARSIKVKLTDFDGLYVDVVPARPCRDEDAWQLPSREGGWQLTNPLELGKLTTQTNDQVDGQYVPVVKLLRQTRRSLMGRTKPGGLAIEMAALTAFRSGRVKGEGLGGLYGSALGAVGDLLHDAFVIGLELDDPTLPGRKLTIRAEHADKVTLAKRFREAGATVQTALAAPDSDKCAAARSIREMLGKAVDDSGEQDFVFPMPADCNADGSARTLAAVRPGDSRVAGGDRRFG
jgi:hypothetical protein